MNATVSSFNLAARAETQIVEHPNGSADFVISPQFASHYD